MVAEITTHSNEDSQESKIHRIAKRSKMKPLDHPSLFIIPQRKVTYENRQLSRCQLRESGIKHGLMGKDNSDKLHTILKMLLVACSYNLSLQQ